MNLKIVFQEKMTFLGFIFPIFAKALEYHSVQRKNKLQSNVYKMEKEHNKRKKNSNFFMPFFRTV